MIYADRLDLYRHIEEQRDSKVLTFITGDRLGMELIIADDCIDSFVHLLDHIGPTERISLILYTNGGHTLSAWRLINLIRMFCDELEIVIPSKALSAGTLMSIGADKIIMTKQAILGPIDPSVNNLLNPQVNLGGQPTRVPVSVENVRGYLSLTREELRIQGENNLTQILMDLTSHVHPLVLGEIARTITQIRYLARKLLPRQVHDEDKIRSIVDFLCADSGSHDYSIDRREAAELGLNVEKPSHELYELLRQVHLSYTRELQLLKAFHPKELFVEGKAASQAYCIPRGLVESTDGGCYRFISEGVMTLLKIPTEGGAPQEGISDVRSFDGWRKLA